MADGATVTTLPEHVCPVCTKDLDGDGWCFECRAYSRALYEFRRRLEAILKDTNWSVSLRLLLRDFLETLDRSEARRNG